MEDLQERGWWEESAEGTWLDLTIPALTFCVSYASKGEEDPVMADAGKHLHVTDERRDALESRKGARRSEEEPVGLHQESKGRSHGPWANQCPLWASIARRVDGHTASCSASWTTPHKGWTGDVYMSVLRKNTDCSRAGRP